MAVVSLQIDSIAAGGDGVGRTDGLVVFVPRTAPGDVVTAGISTNKHFARGILRSVVKPASQRVQPPCQHYIRDHCGGCQLQHLNYNAQLEAKQRIVKDAMERIAKRSSSLPEIQGSMEEWRYRTKLTLSLRNRNGNWIAGLHKYDDPSRIFPLADCPITNTEVVAAWREVMGASRFLPDVMELRGSVRLTNEGCSFMLSGGERWVDQQRFLDAVPSITAIWWERGWGDSRRERVLLHDSRKERTPAASFAQINPVVAAELRAYVIDKVFAYTPKTLIDAYSGAGDLAVEVAAKGVAVSAIELDRDASEWATSRLPNGSQSLNARVEEALPKLLPAEVVIVNPPRAGLDEAVAEALNTKPPRSIIYVSCNPATLARDLSRMPGLEIKSLRSFDMFPQTAHVETVCELVPKANTQ